MNIEWAQEDAFIITDARNGRAELLDFAETLRRNPGRWGKYPFHVRRPAQFCYRQKRGLMTSLPADQFESRYTKDVIYVRAVTE